MGLSDKVWEHADLALRVHRSADTLAAFAEQQGFRVERGVAGMPTAFVASYGEGAPVIAIMGEYDALPGISQKPTTTKEPFAAGAGGHGCGHNLFGAASLGAAVAVKELIASGTLKGTVRFLGTPAEESIAISSTVVLYAGIMPGGDLFAPETDGHFVERCELEPRVARNTRYGRLAREIALYERLDYRFLKVTLKVEYVERKS